MTTRSIGVALLDAWKLHTSVFLADLGSHDVMDSTLAGLNDAQRVAVTSEAAVLQVLAPPGSGKTKTLTARVAHLIACRGLKPWNIIVCTFTVKAAREMQDRIRAFVGPELEKKLKIGTFHGIALRFLRQYRHYVGLDDKFGVADSSDSLAIIKRIIKSNRYSIEPGAARGRISSQKAKGIDCEQYAQLKKSSAEQQEFQQIFREYQAALDQCNLLDYDDLLLRCASLLNDHPECVDNVEAVLVDEFQDTNGVQYDLMRLFAQRRSNITIVGDPDQCIYGWRSAEIRNLGRMKERWPDTLTVNLEENYRSGGAILHAAQKIIEQDESRPPKRLQATHNLGRRPIVRRLPSAKDEATWLVSEVSRLKALTGGLLVYSDFAVLLRTASLSRVIEAALGKAGLPYRMVGGLRFYDRAEVKIMLDYLRVINQPSHSEALERILNVPPRKIGDKSIESLRAEAQNRNVTLWSLVVGAARGQGRLTTTLSSQALRGIEQFAGVVLCGQRRLTEADCSVVDVMNIVLQKISFQDFLKHKYSEDHEARWANVEELIAQAADSSIGSRNEISQDQPDSSPSNADAPDTEDTPLSAFLANAALTASADEKASEDGIKSEQITISTIHAAKGLEWPVIFVPACYNGSIPHSRAEDNDEERRLLYVAMTRAQAVLYLSCPVKDTLRQETTMSVFLTEPGVSSYFEEHGPSISAPIVQGLAGILRRESPSVLSMVEGKAVLERDEDNYWPLNGEYPLGESAKLVHIDGDDGLPVFGTTKSASWIIGQTSMQQQQGSTTFASGFSSVKSQYDDLVRKQEELEMRKLDRRAKKKDEQFTAQKGRKRHVEGQGTLSHFFSKRSRGEEGVARPEMPLSDALAKPPGPLRDISNQCTLRENDTLAEKVPASSAHRPCTQPLLRKQPASTQAQTGYIFLSSSPPKADADGGEHAGGCEGDGLVAARPFKTASTLHTTSMQSVGTGRKTLGVKRSLNGWAARGARR